MPKIVTTHPLYPPIPTTSFDWCATFEGYEPGCPIGHGPTEKEAVENLLEQVDPDSL